MLTGFIITFGIPALDKTLRTKMCKSHVILIIYLLNNDQNDIAFRHFNVTFFLFSLQQKIDFVYIILMYIIYFC